jgi:hypothetical protein
VRRRGLPARLRSTAVNSSITFALTARGAAACESVIEQTGLSGGSTFAQFGFRVEPLVQRRRRIKHTATFEDRLSCEAHRLKEQAKELPPGLRREQLLRKARQAETAAQISQWLASPGLASPK